MQTVVTLTLNPAVDKSTAVDSVASEIKLRCDAPTYDAGGGGVNVSRAVHKLGGTSTAIYTSGGSVGETLQHLLNTEGLHQHIIPTQAWTRENFIVFEKSTTLQYRFGMSGAALTPAEVEACLEATLGYHANYIVASGSLPPNVPNDFYAQLAGRVRGTGTRLIVDTSGAALEAMRGAGAFLLKPNITEVEILSGKRFEGEEQLIVVAREMIAAGMAEVLAVSLGGSGAMFVTANDYALLKPPVVPIKSKVGAGDSMVGGITYALANNWELLEAVRWGVACGTACVMTEGTQLFHKADVESIYPRVRVLREV